MSAQALAPRPRRGFGARLREKDDYGLVLLLILTTIVVISLGYGSVGQFVGVCLMGATLLFVLHTSDARKRTFRTASAIVLAAVAGSALSLVTGADRATDATALVGLLLAFAAPIVILRRILRSTRITVRVVLGALAIYLLVGLTYSYLYPLVHVITDQPFFVQTATPGPIDYIYFSYVTLTTVGFGDLTPATSTGRMIAVSEALSGQLYLVSAVALLVGNIGRQVGRAPDGDRELETGLGAATEAPSTGDEFTRSG
jgi:hypothetical protein